jgi:hypothetical protein
MYADDMIIASKSKEDLQECLKKLIKWVDTNGFKINQRKRVMMLFSNGSRVAANNIFFKQKKLEILNTFKHSGLIPTRTSFIEHIE